jgi:hypothetical protein
MRLHNAPFLQGGRPSFHSTKQDVAFKHPNIGRWDLNEAALPGLHRRCQNQQGRERKDGGTLHALGLELFKLIQTDSPAYTATAKPIMPE